VGLVVIFPVLVGELKLRTPILGQSLFPLVQFIHVSYPMGQASLQHL